MAVDPTVLHCTTRVVQLHCEDIRPEQGGSGPRVKQFMSEAWDFGLRAGASFPVHGSQGKATALCLASDTDSANSRTHVSEHLDMSQLLIGYVHEAVRQVIVDNSRPISKVQLTECEREYLTWLPRPRLPGKHRNF